MDYNNLSKSRIFREIAKERLNDYKHYKVRDLFSYVKGQMIERNLIQSEDEITSGICSRAMQDLLLKESGRYGKTDDGYFKIREDIEMTPLTMKAIQILDESKTQLIKLAHGCDILDISEEDMRVIKNIKKFIAFVDEQKVVLQNIRINK